MYFIQPGIKADQLIVIFLFGAVSTEHRCFLGQFRIISNKQSTIAICAKVLGWKERKAAGITNCSDLPAFILAAKSLSHIFNHDQIMLSGNFKQRVHIHGLSE
ncbi:hypothetical protein D3C78_1389130 [compost metagenome]